MNTMRTEGVLASIAVFFIAACASVRGGGSQTGLIKAAGSEATALERGLTSFNRDTPRRSSRSASGAATCHADSSAGAGPSRPDAPPLGVRKCVQLSTTHFSSCWAR
jgi:hypothetical protein